MVIVGASAAGLRCASRLARLEPEWKITVVEQQEIFSYAACGLPYVLSGDIEDIQSLRRTKDGMIRNSDYFSSVKGVNVLSGWRAQKVDSRSRKLIMENREGSRSLDYDEIVLAVGAGAKRLPNMKPHPRMQTFHTYEDVQPINEDLAHGRIQKVAIIGAGLVGCELAEAFTAMWGAEVTLIEAAPHPLPFIVDPEVGAVIKHVYEDQQVDLICNCKIERIEADDQGVNVFMQENSLRVDMVIAALGVQPRVELAKNCGVELGGTGAIAVDDRMHTSVPNIWAVGDCAEVIHVLRKDPVCMPLGSLANRQGRTLANILAERPDRFPAVVGATVVKVFDWNVAATGINRYVANLENLKSQSVWVSLQDKADYWPEVKNVFIQLTYDPDDMKVLGVQAVGEGEVAKRIDAATQLIGKGATLNDFVHLEHAYAPPYAPALDPLAVAAMVATNHADGVEAISPLRDLGEYRVLDVRHANEVQNTPVKSAGFYKNIPQEEIFDHFEDLESVHAGSADQSKPMMVICARGARSAEVVRRLAGRGLKACYLGGGLIWHRLVKAG